MGERMNGHSRQFQAESSALVALDMTGKIWHWDCAAERLFGWPAMVVLGQQAVEVLIPDRLRAYSAAICAQVIAGRTWSGRHAFRRRDGEEILLDLVHTPIQTSNGKVVGIVGAHQLALPPWDSVV